MEDEEEEEEEKLYQLYSSIPGNFFFYLGPLDRESDRVFRPYKGCDATLELIFYTKPFQAMHACMHTGILEVDRGKPARFITIVVAAEAYSGRPAGVDAWIRVRFKTYKREKAEEKGLEPRQSLIARPPSKLKLKTCFAPEPLIGICNLI